MPHEFSPMPDEYLEIHLADRQTGSSAAYPLGTDHLGRDVSRVIFGAGRRG